MRTTRVLTVVLASLACLCVGAVKAQERDAAAQPSRLALKVVRFPGAAPVLDAVPDSPGRDGSWTPMFRRVSSYKLLPGSLPVRAVDIRSHAENDKVKIIVSVHTGERFHERQEPVATYLAGVDETIVARELTRFGVEPFEITVVRLPPSYAAPPSILNRTTSIEVLNVEVRYTTLPSVELTLRNSSSKAVRALALNVLADGKVQLAALPHHPDGRPLIEAGATFKRRVGLGRAKQLGTGDDTPEAAPDQTVEIAVAVFDDGTYEGEPRRAATVAAFTRARKNQLTRVVRLLRSIVESAGETGAASTLARLRTQIGELPVVAPPVLLAGLKSDFPTLGEKERADLADAVEVMLNGIKREFREQLDLFLRSDSHASDEAAGAWLRATLKSYEETLARF